MPRLCIIMLSSLFDFGTVNKDKKCCSPPDLDKDKNVETVLESLSESKPVSEFVSSFQLPIQYNSAAKPVPETVLLDPEMHQSQSDAVPMNHYLFAPSSPFAEKMAAPMVKYFTTDKGFLQDTRDFLMEFSIVEGEKNKLFEDAKTAAAAYTQKDVLGVLEDITDKEGFMDKYYYMEWDSLQSLNRSSTFLQATSVLNGVVPLFNIFMTFLVLVIPFVLILLQGKSLTMETYVEGMRVFGRDNMFTQIFTLLDPKSALDTQGIVMVLAGVALYGYQLYYNIHYTSQFYRHLSTVAQNLLHVRAFLQHSEARLLQFLQFTTGRASYSRFAADAGAKLVVLRTLLQKLSGVQPVGLNVATVTNMGYYYECYYLLHAEAEYRDLLHYCCDFAGFFENTANMARLVREGKLNRVQFDSAAVSEPKAGLTTDDEEVEDEEKTISKTFFQEIYYPTFVTDSKPPVKNDVDLTNHNYIVTGPNASGKTTFLKTVAINVLVSQQVGCGFFLSGRLLEPYTHLHSYINIPDTSERDSLFEAETRRCKEILTAIESNPTTERHFCIFDELFSGTNPEEAAQSATSYLKYLCKKGGQVDFVLTTHYLDVCHAVEECRKSVEEDESEEEAEESAQELLQEVVAEEVAADIAGVRAKSEKAVKVRAKSEKAGAKSEKAGAKTDDAFSGRLVNYRMAVEPKGDSLVMKYRLEPGISEIQGAFFILQNMGFPKEMMTDIGKTRKPVLPVIIEESEISVDVSASA